MASTLLVGSAAGATEVTALTLPQGFTVLPESETGLVTVAPDGTVAALSQSSDNRRAALAVRWDANLVRSTFVPPGVDTTPGATDSPGNPAPRAATAVAAAGAIYVGVSQNFSGAYSGTSYDVQRWVGDESKSWDAPCDSGENGDEHVYAADRDGHLAVTFDRTGRGSFTVMNENSDAAPYAFIVDGSTCHAMGRAIVLDVNGDWASGYRGYLDGKVAPTNLNQIVQRPVAVRWHGTDLHELGAGVAYAVSADGIAVGATAVAGRFLTMTTNFFGNPGRLYASPIPHAVGWDGSGRRFTIEDRAARSVAYDVADDGTAVGMLQTGSGEHYAFRRYRGHVQRLDDLPHPAGWRFESAYAIENDGTVVGIGTLNGVATVFRWRP